MQSTLDILVNKSSGEPAYRQIASRLRELILSGTIPEGERLPPSRRLSKSLGVNRVTVTAAYGLLERQGLVEGHVGRGTFVRKASAKSPGKPAGRRRAGADATREASSGPAGGLSGRSQPRDPRSTAAHFWTSRCVEEPGTKWSAPVLHAPKGTIFLDYALPPTDLFLVDQFRRCLNEAIRRNGGEVLQMGPTDGYPPLKEYIAAYMTDAGTPASPEEILVTNGCQQALDLVKRVFVGYEGAVVLEEPTYPGAINIFTGGNIKRLSIPMTGTGPDMAALESALAHNSVKLIYTIPNYHNPTGATMSRENRIRLLELASAYGTPIIEDDTYAELSYGGPRFPSLKSMDSEGIVLYLNSFSKVNFPGIRVGWISGPRAAIERLEAAKRTCDLHTDLLAQTGLYEFLRRGLLDKHLRNVRRIYRERRDVMVAALERRLAPAFTWIKPHGGLALWAVGPRGVDSERLLRAAVARGVAFSCGKGFYSGTPDPRTLRLCFASEPPEKIETGIRRLARALEDTMAEGKRTAAKRTLSGRPMM